MNSIDRLKEKNLILRVWQGIIIFIIGSIVEVVFKNFQSNLNTFQIIGIILSLFLVFALYFLQKQINKNAKRMKDL
jgi:predicted transporter